MEFVRAIIFVAFYLVLTVGADFFLPGAVRLRAFAFFKSNPAEFYAAYNGGRPIRFTVVSALSFGLFLLVGISGSKILQEATFGLAVASYITLLCFAIWMAEAKVSSKR